VHGNAKEQKAFYDLDGDTVPTSWMAAAILRKLLLSRLTSNPPWTIGDLDDALLSSLTRDIAAQPADPEGESPAGSRGGDQQLPTVPAGWDAVPRTGR
jgi:hypothetical protein